MAYEAASPLQWSVKSAISHVTGSVPPCSAQWDMTLSAPSCPLPTPSSMELWYSSSLHWPTDGRGRTRSIPPNQPNGAAEYIPSCNKSPEEPHWPLEVKRWGLGEEGVMFTWPPRPDSASQLLKLLLTWRKPTTASCLLALVYPTVRISWLHYGAAAHWPGYSPLPASMSDWKTVTRSMSVNHTGQ